MTTVPAARRNGRGARERITAAAAKLFYSDGIHATGVDTLIHEAQVSKRTFYQHFSSKAELVDSYLQNIDARGGSPMERRLDTDGLAPRERLLAIFDSRTTGRFRGCPFHNAVVESAGTLATAENVVRAHKQDFAERLMSVATDAGATDPWLLAQQLLVLFEGATALSTTLNDTSPVVHARAAAAQLIDAALNRGPAGAS